MVRMQCDQIWRNIALWQNFQSLGQLYEWLFPIWENSGPTLANFVNGQIVKNILAIWSHCSYAERQRKAL